MSSSVGSPERTLQDRINHLRNRVSRLHYVINNGIFLTEEKKNETIRELSNARQELRDAMEYKSKVF